MTQLLALTILVLGVPIILITLVCLVVYIFTLIELVKEINE